MLGFSPSPMQFCGDTVIQTFHIAFKPYWIRLCVYHNFVSQRITAVIQNRAIKSIFATIGVSEVAIFLAGARVQSDFVALAKPLCRAKISCAPRRHRGDRQRSMIERKDSRKDAIHASQAERRHAFGSR